LEHWMTRSEPTYAWAVPGHLERGDRLIITGDEGQGKSVLCRQIGLGAAAGVNPFAVNPEHRNHEPLIVAQVDCENSGRQLRREFGKALAPIAEVWSEVIRRYFLEIRTDGLILDDPADRSGDRGWLQSFVATVKPGLLILGPLYKLMGGDPTGEEDSRELAKFLDRLRGRTQEVAVVIEAHAPHGPRRPFGWSGWKRWPEFGYHLDAEGGFTRWRGDRDTRSWPTALTRGGQGQWLWLPATAPAAPAVNAADEYDASVRVKVLSLFREAPRPFTMDEIVDRSGRRRSAVIAAVRYLQDRGWFIVGQTQRVRTNGRPYPVDTFALDPDGPGG
jgi:replicative DNA helicase